MKPIYAIAALLLISAVAFVLWQRVFVHTATLTCKQAQPTIVAFGDSLVYGYGAPQGQGFIEDLSKASGVPILNRGIVGNTSAEGLARMNDIADLHPAIVIVLFGGNDAIQRVPQQETEANLDTILSRLATGHITAVLLGVQGGVLADPYAPMYERLAKKYGVPYVPNVLSGILGHPDLMFDEIHPNAAGYAKIAERVLPALETACSR